MATASVGKCEPFITAVVIEMISELSLVNIRPFTLQICQILWVNKAFNVKRWPEYYIYPPYVSVISQGGGACGYFGCRSCFLCLDDEARCSSNTLVTTLLFLLSCHINRRPPLKWVSSYGRARHLSAPGLHRRGHQGGSPPEIQGGFSFIHCRCSAHFQRCPVQVTGKHHLIFYMTELATFSPSVHTVLLITGAGVYSWKLCCVIIAPLIETKCLSIGSIYSVSFFLFSRSPPLAAGNLSVLWSRRSKPVGLSAGNFKTWLLY